MSLEADRIAFIGCGTMGEAMVKGLLSNRLIAAERIAASHPRLPRTTELARRHGIATTPDNAAACSDATLVVVTVKPQVLDEVLADLRGHVTDDVMVVSIVAGATPCPNPPS